MERLLWEVNSSVAFTSSWVTQYRNPHSYDEDFAAEHDLYAKGAKLLDTLAGWENKPGQTLPEALISIVVALHQAGILGANDVSLMRAWVSDLQMFGYAWPAMSTPQPARPLAAARVVDERRNDLTAAFPHQRRPPPSLAML